MALSSLTITINNNRVIDGFVATLNRENEGSQNRRSLAQFVLQQVNAIGRSMGQSEKLGVISSANFILRFTNKELNDIRSAAKTNSVIAQAFANITDKPEVPFDDEQVFLNLQTFVTANLLAAARVSELLAYVRPEVV